MSEVSNGSFEKHFGEHVTVDGYGGNFDKLENKKVVRDVLDDLPEKLGMRKLSRPKVYRGRDNGIKDPGGWTGVVVIEESHISVHTFSKRGFLTADVYSCKNGMNVEFIVNYFKEKFDLKEIEYNLIKRGLKYPGKNIY